MARHFPNRLDFGKLLEDTSGLTYAPIPTAANTAHTWHLVKIEKVVISEWEKTNSLPLNTNQ